MDASPALETPMRLPWPSRIARRPRQAMFVPRETCGEEARKETLERRESDAFEVVPGSVRRGERTLFKSSRRGGGETGVSARREA